MKKNYLKLFVLILITIIITLGLSAMYKQKFLTLSYSFDRLNKITANEFNEYIIENPSTILYIGDKTNNTYNKIEKNFISKLESLNLLENTIYIEKSEVTPKFIKKLKEEYKYTYDEGKLPTILVIIDGIAVEKTELKKDSSIDTIIEYGVFE